MFGNSFSQSQSIIDRIDSRLRILSAAAFSFLVVLSGNFLVPSTVLAGAVVMIMVARLPVAAVGKRLAAVNVPLVLLAVLLPFSVPGSPLFAIGPLAFSREGLLQVALIAVKCNAAVLLYTVLVSTMEAAALGQALAALHVPEKLVHLFLFTVRYLEVLRGEYLRLVRAMRVRCFRPGLNRHTFRTIGYLVGMLLVKGFNRSERIVAAMKCRGFRGRFYLMTDFTFCAKDAAFGAVAGMIFGILLYVELM